MKNRANKFAVWLALVCLLVSAFAVPAFAASYSKVYGQTQDRLRVRDTASMNATVLDNIVKDACVYVTSSKENEGNTFVKVNYIGSDGEKLSGWVIQQEGNETYVKILSKSQAKDKFGVSGGDLPSKKVGTFSAERRESAKASASSSSSSSSKGYIQLGSKGDAVKTMQTKLKEMGFYSGELTGNVGEKTEAAIKAFQSKHGLTADGVAGPQTLAKIDAEYASRGNGDDSSSSGSGSSLSEGSKGTAVSELQRNLTTLGYYWADITGNFGTKTETAVKRFQEENGLTADGKAGKKTLAAIAGALEKKGGSSSSSSSTSTSSSSSSGTTLTLNSQGTLVTQVQTDLKKLGYYFAEITGHYGEKTEAAVKKFQSENNLTADGKAGVKTRKAIEDAVKAAGGSSSLGSDSSTSSSSSSSSLKLESTGDKVRQLQNDLTTLGFYWADITGHFGAKTETAVKKFQKSRGLTQDGIVGKKTQDAINSALKGTSSSGSSSAATVSGTLREGDSGEEVRELQERLEELGYYYGDITGSFGTLTRKAVRKFQDDNDLTVDGIAGPATLKKLAEKTGGGSIVSDTSTGGTTVSESNSYAEIAKKSVYLRKSYSTSSAAVTSLAQGTRLRITRKYNVSGETWYYVSVNSGNTTLKGYVRGDMVNMIEAPDEDWGIDVGEAEILGILRITANKVRRRTQPSTDADVVDVVNTGDIFYYVNSIEDWYQCKGGSWVMSKYASPLTPEEANDYEQNDSGDTYREGDTGSMVKWLQESLAKLGYYKGTVSGEFGSLTKEAVRLFQRDRGLSSDGVAGPKTIAQLNYVLSSGVVGSVDQNIENVIYNIDWFKYLYVFRTSMPKGTEMTLTDFTTNKSFRIRVQSVGNHLDVEPLTSADTKVLCSLYNVSSAQILVEKDLYQRRAMIATVKTKNGLTLQFVCSIYAIPHGTDTISGNDFDGQFCVHFLNSRTHGSDSVDTRADGHQDLIKRAVTSLKKQNKTVLETPPYEESK